MMPELDGNAIETELERLRDTQLDREQVNEIVRGLGEIVGIEDLTLDESGVAELVVDDDVELSLIHLPIFPGVVAAVPMPEGAEKDAGLLRKLLQTNMSWAMTQGGCFVFVPPRVALCRLVPLGPGDSERLDQELATFISLGKAWRDEVSSYLVGDREELEDAGGQEDDAAVGLRV